MNRLAPLLLLALALCTCDRAQNDPMSKDIDYPTIPVTYPETATVDHTDDYHGTQVADEYRWLENDNAEDTKAWVAAQNEATFGYLKNIPFRQQFAGRMEELVNYPRIGAPNKVGDYYIFSKNDGLQNQSVYYYKKGEDGQEKVFIDPNTLNDEGTTAIGLLGSDKQNRYMAYRRSEAGSDWGSIYVRDIASNTDLEDQLDWVKFSGAAWYGDGFFYSRYPAPKDGEALKGNNLDHSVYYHQLGTEQSADKLIYADKANPSYYNSGGTTEEEDYFILYSSPGTDGFTVYYYELDGKNPPSGKPTLLFGGTANKSSVVHTEGKDFWVRTDIDAPNYRLIKMNLDRPAPENWVDVLPESENLLASVSTGGGQLFANYLEKATDRYYRMNYDGSNKTPIDLPGLGSAGGFSGEADEMKLYYGFTSFIYPYTIFEYDVATGESRPFFQPDLKFQPEDFVEKQVTYTSKDGTPVTMLSSTKRDWSWTATTPPTSMATVASTSP